MTVYVPSRNATLRSHFGADRHPTLSLPTLYFALFRGDPASGGVEPGAAGAYARVAKTNDATLFGTILSTDVSCQNKGASGVITWPTATALYSIGNNALTHWAIFDNTTGGNLWYSGPLTQQIFVTGAGDIPRLPLDTWVATADV